MPASLSSQRFAQLKALFFECADMPSDERDQRLALACEGDWELVARARRIFASDEFADGVSLAADFGAPFAPTAPPPGPAVGDEIDGYRLMEILGEGGMGIVYVAEQSQPVRRLVALKVIKPGMDSQQVIARFEAERQALAMMDHPHIAKVFDGGTTAQGRPYFVMELVRGTPITELCDEGRFTIRQRLQLFVDVCRAVQHAHQKGIIHRDLKPTNVLVTWHDDKPVPKVIDFGVAKAVNQPPNEHSVYTQFSQVIGTPLYMSPEQAQMSALDIDTRSDVYSLGVLLYELLTGTTPFDSATLQKAGMDEFRRIIREDAPAQPSHRLSTLIADAGSTVSQKRSLDPRRLKQLIRGELDWIVMRALEKDRNRRYQSAGELAEDVERFLSDLPIHARAPSLMLRVRKWRRRHPVATIAIAAIIILLSSLSAGGYWYRSQMANSRAVAKLLHEESLVRQRVLRQALFCPDGKLLAATQNDYSISFWDFPSGNPRGTLRGHTRNIDAIAFSPDGTTLASGGQDGTIRLWNVSTHRELFTLRQYPRPITWLSFLSPRCLVAGDGNWRSVHVFDAEDRP